MALLLAGWATTAYSSLIHARKRYNLQSLEAQTCLSDPVQSSTLVNHTWTEFSFLHKLVRDLMRFDDKAMHLAVLKAYAIPSIAARVSGAEPLAILDRNASDLTNEELVYLISLLIVEPVNWVEIYGYRRLSLKEKAVRTKT